MVETLHLRKIAQVLNLLSGAGSVGILLCLTWASLVLVSILHDSPETIAGWLPIWLALLVMPVAFLFMAVVIIINTPGLNVTFL